MPLVKTSIDYTVDNPVSTDTTQYDIFQEYLQFSQESASDVLHKIAHFKALTSQEYTANPSSFYETSQSYIYDILGGNMSTTARANLINHFIPGLLAELRTHPHASFADFGGGVGAVCSIAATLFDDVTYIDLETNITDFARYRFRTRNEAVQMVIIPSNDFTLPRSYDIICTDAVWEHLPPHQQIGYLAKVVSYLNSHGVLIFLVDLSGESPDMPMHFNVDIGLLHYLLTYMGMQCMYGHNTFASVWQKCT